MKKLILLATLFLLTSCDALTGDKPKPSTTPTPLASESSDPNAPVASGATGTPSTEPPGPTSSGSPLPSQMPTNPALAGNLAVPPPPTSVVGGQPVIGLDQTSPGKITAGVDKSFKVPGQKPANASSDQSSIAAAINVDPSVSKGNSKDPKTKVGTGAKKTAESLDPAAANPNTSGLKTATSQTIADGGIGAAKVGMTLAELKKNLKNSARFETQTDFIPGYNALAVKQRGKVQFYIPYPKQRKVTDSDQIKLLVTDNPLYKTAEGISPGMSIKKVTEVYGGAQLENNPKIGEIAIFANQPGELLFFTSGTESSGRAGIYPVKQKKEQGLITDKYASSGRIKRITVVCPENVCPSN